MPSDPLLKLDETDIESIQIFCEEESRVRRLRDLIEVIKFGYKFCCLKHNDRPTQFRNVINSNTRKIEERFRWKMDEVIGVLNIIDDLVTELGNPSRVAVSTIYFKAKKVLGEYPEDLISTVPWYVRATPRKARRTVPFVKRLRLED